MVYNTKVIIDGLEITATPSEDLPFISDVVYKNSTSLEPFAIGATGCDSLSFKINNPTSQTFDGARVELWLAEASDDGSAIGDVEDEAEGLEEFGVVDDDDAEALDDDSEDGEELTAEEEAETDAAAADTTDAEFERTQGEELTAADEETGEEEEEEWQKLGAFYVVDQQESGGAVLLACYDAMSKLVGIFHPTQATGNIGDLFDEFRQQVAENFGVIVDAFDFPEKTITWSGSYSYRQAAGLFAGFVGGYMTVGADETLGVSFYTYADGFLLTDDVQSYVSTSAGAVQIGAITCDTSPNAYKSEELTVGAGQGVSFANPFVDEDALQNIYALYNGVTYEGAKLTAIWRADMVAGELVRIMTRDEAVNYLAMLNAVENATDADEIAELKQNINSAGKTVLISNYGVTFGGDAVATIDSLCPTEYAKENAPERPTDATFRNLYAEMIEAEYLRAKGAFIADLAADNFTVGSINGHAITDGSILASALSETAVQLLSGTHVFYQNDEPTAVAVGDVWYRTVADVGDVGNYANNCAVWDGEAWQTTPLDANVFRAGSITAREIAAATITAGNIDMDSLQANLARIGEEEGVNITLEDGSIYFKNGETNMARIFINEAEGGDSGIVLTTDGGYYGAWLSGDGAVFSHKNSVFDTLDGEVRINPFEIRLKDSNAVNYNARIKADGGAEFKYINSDLFAVTNHQIHNGQIAAEGYASGTAPSSGTFQKAGYYPLGIVGWASGTRYFGTVAAQLTSKAVGSCKVGYMVANHHSSAHTATVTVDILWVKVVA